MPKKIDLKEYKLFIKRGGIKVNKLRAGFFYSYDYDFSKDYPLSVLKFFDKMPLTFMYSVKAKDLMGFNLHHLPFEFRNKFITYLIGKHTNPLSNKQSNRLMAKAISKLLSDLFDDKGKVKSEKLKRIVGKGYRRLKKAMEENSLIVRHYKRFRMKNVVLIPLELVPEAITYKPETFEAVTYAERVKEFYRLKK